MEIDSSEEEQMGGLAAPSLQSRQVLQRLYDPKLTQARFTGLSSLDPSAKRLRPKQAMDYWSTKQIEAKLKEPEIDVVEIDPEPQPASAQSKESALEGTLALIRERGLVACFPRCHEVLKARGRSQNRIVGAPAGRRGAGSA